MSTRSVASKMTDKNNGCTLGIRHVQALLISLSMYTLQCIGVGNNIAILAMTDQKSITNITTYNWDKQTIGYIFSMPFWGNLLVQILIGPVIHKYGGKPFTTMSLAGAGIVQFIMPFFAYLGDWKGMCFGFILNSFFVGAFFPSMQTLLGKWAPINERTRMGISIYIGLNVAFIVSLPLSAYISTFSYGWKGIYYFHGCQALICCFLWVCFGSSSPSEHKSISKAERELILSSLEQTSDVKLKNTPWKIIFKCKPYWATLIIHAGSLWSFFVISVEMPAFFKHAVGTDLQNSGLFTSFGYILAIVFGLFSSWIADYLLINKYLNLTRVRKLFSTFGTWCPAVCILIITYIPMDHVKTIVSITTLLAGLDAMGACGYVMNFVDLSPYYCGSLVSVSSVLTSFMCLIAPILNGYILDDITDVLKWRKVFMVASGTYFFGNLMFLIFGSGERQPWDRAAEDEPTKDKASEKMIVEVETV